MLMCPMGPMGLMGLMNAIFHGLIWFDLLWCVEWPGQWTNGLGKGVRSRHDGSRSLVGLTWIKLDLLWSSEGPTAWHGESSAGLPDVIFERACSQFRGSPILVHVSATPIEFPTRQFSLKRDFQPLSRDVWAHGREFGVRRLVGAFRGGGDLSPVVGAARRRFQPRATSRPPPKRRRVGALHSPAQHPQRSAHRP